MIEYKNVYNTLQFKADKIQFYIKKSYFYTNNVFILFSKTESEIPQKGMPSDSQTVVNNGSFLGHFQRYFFTKMVLPGSVSSFWIFNAVWSPVWMQKVAIKKTI